MSTAALYAQSMRLYYSLRGVRFMPLNAVAHHVRDRDLRALAELVRSHSGDVPAVIERLLAEDPRHAPVIYTLRSMHGKQPAKAY